jgi:hypothetical protein
VKFHPLNSSAFHGALLRQLRSDKQGQGLVQSRAAPFLPGALFLGVREGRGSIPSLDQRCRKILHFHDAPAKKTSDTSFESISGDRLESPAKATSMVALRHCGTKESRAASD